MYHPVKPRITCFLTPGAYILAPYLAFFELSSSAFLHLCFCTLCLLHPAHLLGYRSGVASSIIPFLTPFSSCLEQLFLTSSLGLIKVPFLRNPIKPRALVSSALGPSISHSTRYLVDGQGYLRNG